MESKKTALTERPLFVGCLTFLGGLTNSYGYVTRDGFLPNMHTGNMTRLGMSLADGDFHTAGGYLLVILGCVLGAATGEAVKGKVPKQYDSRAVSLGILALALAVVGLLPDAVPQDAMSFILTFITGYLLTLFRKTPWGVCNVTICTGNLRSVGQFLYNALDERTAEAWIRLALFTLVVAGFVLGAWAGVPLSRALGKQAAIAIALVPFGLMCAVLAEKKHEVKA